MKLLIVTYPGEPRDDMENAIESLAERFGGYMGDSGYCAEERDLEIEFDNVTDSQMQEVEVGMKALGCTFAEWT